MQKTAMRKTLLPALLVLAVPLLADRELALGLPWFGYETARL